MAFTVCYALLGSMLMALTLIPVLATYLFRHAPEVWENPVLALAVRALRARAARARLRIPGACLAAAGAVVAAAFGIAALLGTEFLPQLDEGVVWIRANFPAGISLAKSAELASEIRRARQAVARSAARSRRKPAATTMARIRTARTATSSSSR